MNVLHGLTGSVASILSPKFDDAYFASNLDVEYVVTQSALNFKIDRYKTNDDELEWKYYTEHNKVLHIDLVKDNDILVIAPLSANTLAKIANGICDNLLTCVARAWDFNKPFIVAPSMNTRMYEHPITKEHIAKIESWGIKVISPVEKTLFCGDYGIGAMAPIEQILEEIKKYE